VVLEICQELGIPTREAEMTRYDVYTADECFLTGTAAEVIAAIVLDTRPIGTGRPGPVTERIIARFRELTRSTGTEIYG
jgi:branched-chain amino acid aminotransferase